MGKTHKIGAMVMTVVLAMGMAAAPVAAFSLGNILGGVTGKRGVNYDYFKGHPRPQKENRWQIYNPNGQFKIWGKVIYPDGSDAANVDFILASSSSGSSENVIGAKAAYEGKTDAQGKFSVSFNGGFQVNVIAWKGNLIASSRQADYTGKTPVLMELEKTKNGKDVGFRHDGDHT